ncbi:hypothetical protein [Sphingopyxis sp. MSC1_008]|jgi:hypothetical protein|uniref:hypothetical protein n=1 Tax=Sphingopyxis sp. MSC1_008 TaxID=2909265 RepID=UPI0020BDDD10|nr:hypothetical protein [Sphingopyxis sp. MSC1_008]
MNHFTLAIATCLSMNSFDFAHAQESLDQLEPVGGEKQIEWLGTFGGDREHGLELLVGVSDRLAIGGEIEFEGPNNGLTLDEASAILLYRFNDPKATAVGFGLMGEVSMGRGARVTAVEARGIAENQNERWWLQGNAILRHAREGGRQGTGIAYSVSIQRSVAGMWIGLEASGHAVRLGGQREFAPQGNHYTGPSVTIERDFGAEGEIEIGLAWLHRMTGDGVPSAPRAFVQYTF